MKLVKRGGTWAAKWPQSKYGPVLLGQHSESRAILVMGFPSPSQLMGYPKLTHHRFPPNGTGSPGSVPLSGASFIEIFTSRFGSLAELGSRSGISTDRSEADVLSVNRPTAGGRED